MVVVSGYINGKVNQDFFTSLIDPLHAFLTNIGNNFFEISIE
jgi:hypothetical protein